MDKQQQSEKRPRLWKNIEDVTQQLPETEEKGWDAPEPPQKRAVFRLPRKIKQGLFALCICILALCAGIFLYNTVLKQQLKNFNAFTGPLQISSTAFTETFSCEDAENAKNFIQSLRFTPAKKTEVSPYPYICLNFSGSGCRVTFYNTGDKTFITVSDEEKQLYYQGGRDVYTQVYKVYENTNSFFNWLYNTNLMPLHSYNRGHAYLLDGLEDTIQMAEFCLENAGRLSIAFISKIYQQDSYSPHDANVYIPFSSLQPFMSTFFGQSLEEWEGPAQLNGITADLEKKVITVPKEILAAEKPLLSPEKTPAYTLYKNGDVEAVLTWQGDNPTFPNLDKEIYLFQKNQQGEYILKQMRCVYT